ncbi:MAG: serine/threonine-protein phosphatase [Clostridia bacterium]|nr:serine/threonine-protein phosphatase [Clostridia bacterium]
MEDKKVSVWGRLRQRLTPDEMFHETEVQANRLGALILLCSGIILMLILVFAGIGIFPLMWDAVFTPSIQAIAEIIILLVIYKIVKGDRWWMKPLLIIGLVIVYARLDSILTHKAAILMVIPVVFSSRYFSRKLSVFTAIFTTVVFMISAIFGATQGMINLNIVTMEEGTQMVATGGFLGEAVRNAGVSNSMLIGNTLLYDFFPKWLMFSVVAIISCNIARRGRYMVMTQHAKDVRAASIEYELNLSSSIQSNMLPHVFPPYPDRCEFDIFASMDPAKEVGGDFYDFFLIDDDHICLVMADVSGKGIPASLFMMASKIMFKNYAMSGKSPADIFKDSNDMICSDNREDMFVTAWLGILEISSGKLIASNAGHEDPVIMHPGGNFERFKDRHCFVIGGFKKTKYTNYELTLEPGSKIFLYTDGVPEATDASDQMFGYDRMLEALNSDCGAATDQLLKNVRSSVDAFVKDAEQFDDLTMLCLEYKGK